MRTLNSEELTLSPGLKNGLKEHNFTELTELQETITSVILKGKDVFAKTDDTNDKITSFAISALQKISNAEQTEGTKALFLSPSAKTVREIDDLLSKIDADHTVERAAIDQETDADERSKMLQNRPGIIASTPASLLESMQDLLFIFRHAELVVIDAADQMIANKLMNDINSILKRILNNHQTVIFTGEINDEVKELANDKLEEPAVIGVEGSDNITEPPEIDNNLSHGYIYVPSRMKITTLMAHLDDDPDDICVIFTASKRGTDRLYKTLRKRNRKATSIHGKLSDKKRSQRFANFTNGDAQYLLVADISAAELDLSGISQVINYDVPNDPDEYRYRADLVSSGNATRLLSLVSKQDRSDINVLESNLGKAPKEQPLPDKVKQKVKQRKNNKKQRRSKRNRNNGRNKQAKKANKELELPRPSYDKLSGGRKGNDSNDSKQDEKSGVIGLIKKLFS